MHVSWEHTNRTKEKEMQKLTLAKPPIVKPLSLAKPPMETPEFLRRK